MANIEPDALTCKAQLPVTRKVRKPRVAATQAERSVLNFGLIPAIHRRNRL